MGLLEEIMKKARAAASPDRITWFGAHCFIEGARRVLCVTSTRVEVQTAEGRLSLTGAGLVLREYDEDDLLVTGAIKAVEKL